MRIAFITDIHVREKDIWLHQRLLADLVEEIAAEEPDVVLIGGDLAGRQVPHLATPGERNALANFLGSLSFNCPVYVCRGNHDEPEDWDFLNLIPGVAWITRPTHLRGSDILVLPWIDYSEYLIEGGDGESYAEFVESTYLEASKHSASVILAHCAHSGAAVRLGQPDVPTQDPVIDMTGIAKEYNAKAVLMGHYHDPQSFTFDRPDGTWGKCLYGGATFISEFGEDTTRGWWMIDTETGESIHHVIEQPIRWRIEFDPGRGDVVTGISPSASLIGRPLEEVVRALEGPKKIVAKGKIDALGALRHRVVELQSRDTSVEALSVEAEETISLRDGAESVAGADSMEEKLLAWLAAQDPQPRIEWAKRAYEILKRLEAGEKVTT